MVGVSDGDTITVLYQGNKQYKIRLQHIDCPETAQDFGGKARKILSEKVFGKVVTVKWEEMDRYKRILGDVYIGKQWVNLVMVQEGMAWHYKYYSKDATVAAAESRARAAKVGIWSMPNPTPPWDFRRGRGVAKMEIGQPNTPVFVSRTGAKYHREDCRFVAKSKLSSTGDSPSLEKITLVSEILTVVNSTTFPSKSATFRLGHSLENAMALSAVDVCTTKWTF